jgi:hypothetical protein
VTLDGLRDHAAARGRAGRAAMALYGPVADAPDLADVTGASGCLMLSRKRHVRIDTERLCCACRAMPISGPGPRCGSDRAGFPDNPGSRAGPPIT